LEKINQNGKITTIVITNIHSAHIPVPSIVSDMTLLHFRSSCFVAVAERLRH
jgi:hypothetical protein